MASQASQVPFAGSPEPELTPAEMIARAEAIVPMFIEQQAETEERGYYSQEIHEALRSAGLYQVLHPKRYGGYEFDFDTFFQIVMLVARGCPSSGWMYCLGSHHTVTVASVFPEQAQQEMLGSGHFIAPSQSDPSAVAQRSPDDDGWILNGTYRYCSATPYATYFMGHALIEGREEEMEQIFFAIPRDRIKVLDDSWGDTLGMRGTGSYTVELEGAFTEDHLAMAGTELSHDPRDGSPGLELHGNTMYCGYIHSSYMLQMAAVATGIALGAFDEYDRLMSKNSPYLPVKRYDDPVFLRWYGEAAGQLATCEIAVRGWARRWHEIAGPVNADPYEDQRLGTIANEVIEMAWDAMGKILFKTAGASSLGPHSRLARAFRDLAMLRTHGGLSSGATAGHEALARRRFGLPWVPGSWTADYPRTPSERRPVGD